MYANKNTANFCAIFNYLDNMINVMNISSVALDKTLGFQHHHHHQRVMSEYVRYVTPKIIAPQKSYTKFAIFHTNNSANYYSMLRT